MSSECIVLQGHIPKWDPQGNLTQEQKADMFSFSVQHHRRFNPNAHIIVVGHGEIKPYNLDDADDVIWESPCYPLDANGYIAGMPAQYKSVYKGIARAQEVGFEKCLKSRLDCVIGIPNIIVWSDYILCEENARMLLTQMCGDAKQVGDCFMYGYTGDLAMVWHEGHTVFNVDGLKHIGQAFEYSYHRPEGTSWIDFLRMYIAFRDVNKLKYVDLRRNWSALKPQLEDMLNNPDFDYESYHWGRNNNWHRFDAEGNMIHNCNPEFWSEKQFYA